MVYSLKWRTMGTVCYSSRVTKVQILLKSLTLTVLDNHGIFSSCFSEDDSEISIDLLVCFFQTTPGNDWYDYDNANDCANYCPDVQVKLRNNGNDNGIVGSFRFDIRVRYFSVWNLLLQTRSPRFGSIVVLEMCCAKDRVYSCRFLTAKSRGIRSQMAHRNLNWPMRICFKFNWFP